MISNVTPLPNVEPLSLRDRMTARPAAITNEPLDSHVLLKGEREVLIRHGDKIYRLRHTSNDKLILTK